MKSRSGQVALYLILSLVAVMVLVVMNVGAYLAVSAKNRVMNAGDAAALAVAKFQGELLNRIGELNVEHLKAAIANDSARCREIEIEQQRLSFLGPLDAIAAGNDAARKNGIEISDGMTEILKQHVIDVRSVYATSPELYPSPWEGAWEEYAQSLEIAIGEGLWAGPDNTCFIDAATGHMLYNRSFYAAIAGRNWCWFHFNANSLLHGYGNFRDWPPLPVADIETRRRRMVNSEVYSLHLDRKEGSAVDFLGTNIICRLAGCSVDQIKQSTIITNRTECWFFYDEYEWHRWWEIDPAGGFPVVGSVKKEYDVRGAASICRVVSEIPNLQDADAPREALWAAAAKPFGTVENENGQMDVVTALRGFVVPSFDQVRLVPLDAVGGRDLSTADIGWVEHVKKHLPHYLQTGPGGFDCFYCSQLERWELPSFRRQGIDWLKYNSKSCIRSFGPGSARGGTSHGH